jgi:uncharacterized protein (TIGR02145 family)
VKKFFVLLTVAALFVACGDESSSSAPDPIGEISSSSNDDNGSASSSSQKDSKKSSSSVAEKNSSSSVSGMNSSSSVVESSSSSAILFKQCEEGDTVISEMGLNVFYYRCQDNEWVLDSTVNVVKPKVYPNMDSVFNPAVTYGSFKDPRDGMVYKTVRYYMKLQSGETTFIDSFTMMAQNLNYADTIIDSTTTVFNDSKVEKRCYQDDPWYCKNYFGALYTWSEALGLPKVCDSVGVADNSKCNVKLGDDAKVQGVCPEGWHVMNETEWKDVKNTNSSGMSVLPYGDGTYDSQNSMFWMAHEFKEKPKMGGAFMINGFSTSSASSKYGFLYVRCVMDEGDTFVK